MPEPTPSQLDALLEQCILALEQQDKAAVDAVLAAHPDAAPALRERLDHLAALGILQAPNPAAAIPERLGEFRLLRQIGRGGMGIVYLAEQTALQRNVALKLVHPEQLFFGGARERFRREVLAVARLQHQGIVPILTCGEAEGIPFYAMELVHGASLAEVLAELDGTAPTALEGPLLRAALQRAMAKKKELAGPQEAPLFRGAWANVCCRIVLAAAEALQHAHDQGVLHRDVKPSNLLLTAEGQVRIIDFGLASARGEQRLTQSRATFGSMPYMPPEQVRGEVDRIDARSDVYALGVTLYELLTLTLPHGDGNGNTREHILAGHVEPPSRRNPQIHSDAEAICLMAMDLDPARRYATAAAFADDLRAFLEHRTVRARRPSWLLRVRRWARRNPARAAFAAAAFVVLVPGPLALAAQQNVAAGRIQSALEDAREQRRLAEQRLLETEAEQRRAETNLDHALRAVDLMLLRTAEARLVAAPRTAGLRRQLLEDAIEFHESLIAGDAASAGDQRAREERARSQSRLGALQADLGDLGKAETLLRAAAAELESLIPTSRRAAVQQMELADTLERLAVVLARTDRMDEQQVALRRAIDLFDAALVQGPNARALESSTNARLALAVNLQRGQQAADAFAILDELERRLTDPNGALQQLSATRRTRLLAEAADNRGILLARIGDTQAAQRSFAEALRRLDALPPAGQDAPAVVSLRSGVLERLGLIAQQRREWQQAAPFLDRACADYERLVADEPGLVRWPVRLARVLSARAATRVMLDGADAGIADHDRAVTMLEKARQASPTESDLRRALAIALAERASCRDSRGDHATAVHDFERAEELFAESLQSDASDQLTRNNLAAVMANHASSLGASGDLPAARRVITRAIELCRTCEGSESQRSLVELLGTASDLALRQGDRTAGMELIQEASQRAQALLAEAPDDAARQLTVALTALNHGTACLNLQQLPEAIEIWTAALPTARSVVATSPQGKQILAVTLLRLADVSSRLGRTDAARAWFRAAIEETAVDSTQVTAYPTLLSLFEGEDFRDLLPPGHYDR